MILTSSIIVLWISTRSRYSGIRNDTVCFNWKSTNYNQNNIISVWTEQLNILTCFVFCRLDDIQDNSILRRGIPVAHSIYGIASTINAANYASFIALERVSKLQHPEVSLINFVAKFRAILLVQLSRQRPLF